MARSLAKFVSLVALIAVISSAECLNFCAVYACGGSAAVPVQEQSCHDATESGPAQPASNCTHEPMLVNAKDSIGVPGASLIFLAAAIGHPTPLQSSAVTRTAELAGLPPSGIATKTLILRI